MLAWMGGKRSKLKHARKHHTSKPGQNRSTTAEAGTKRQMASPANKTRARPAKHTKEDLQNQGSHLGKEAVSTAERGQASVSSHSSELEEIATRNSTMDEQEDSAHPAQIQGDANDFDSKWPEHLREIHDCDSEAILIKLYQHEVSQDSKCTKGLKEERKAAVSLDLQAIKLPE